MITAEPEELEARILALTPNMDICSEATSVVRERVSVWVELYPDYGSSSVVGIEGRRTTTEEIQLSNLLSILDSAKRLAQQG